MRIHRLTLCNFRGVRECSIEPRLNGITVIEGDNEVGKSSIVEGLDLLLTYPHDTRHQRVKAVKPAGLDVGAEVEAELSSGPYRFTYRKRWHNKPETTLTIHEPTPVQLSGREAHDRVQALLDETLDRGLWDALRVTQGSPVVQGALGALREGSLGAALDQASEGSAAGEAEESLWVRIISERDRYWTSTMQPKKDRADLRARIAACEEAERTAAAALHELDETARQVESLRAAIVEHEGEFDRLVAERDEVLQLQAGLTLLRSDRERAVGALDTATAQHLAARGAEQARAALVARLRDTTEEEASARALLEQSTPELQQIEARHAAAQSGVVAAEAALAEAEEAERSATRQSKLLGSVLDHTLLRERLDRAREAATTIAEVEQGLARNLVDRSVFDEIEAAHVAALQARAAEQSAASVTIEALAPLNVRIDGHEQELTAGASEVRHALDDVQVELPGIARVTIQASADGRSLARGRAAAEAVLVAALERGGVIDVDAARTALEQRTTAEQQRTHASERLAADLRDLTLEQLEAKVAHLADLLVDAGEDPAAPVTETSPEATDAAAQRVDAAQRALTTCRSQLDAARASASALEAALAEARARAVGASDRVERAERVVREAHDALEIARAEVDDNNVVQVAATAAAAVHAAEAAVAAAAEALRAANADAVDERAQTAQAAVGRAAATMQERRSQLTRLETTLELGGEQGLALGLDEACTELTHLHGEHDSVERRAHGARLLFETFERRRDEARARYAEPLRRAIEQLGRIVLGPDLAVELDDSLAISQRTLDGITLEWDQLSDGVREQLSILGRLACATLVAQDDGVPVIFDDTLGWSDPTRLRAMGAAISAASRTAQVLILTCTPGRYAAVGDAEVIRLPQ